MKKKLIIISCIIVFTPILICATVYFALVAYYAGTFRNGMVINHNYAAGKTPDELNEMLLEKTQKPSFCIIDREGNRYELAVDQFDYAYSYEEELKQILKKQDPFSWLASLVYGTTNQFYLEPKGSFDSEKLNQYLLKLDFMKNLSDPEHIEVEICKDKDGYYLKDDTRNLLDQKLAADKIGLALKDGKTEINLESENCYTVVEYNRAMKETLSLWKKLEPILDTSIVLSFYDGEETLDRKEISEWIATDEEGTILLDDSDAPCLNQEKVEEYVFGLSKKHDTAGGPWTFSPTRGGTVVIEKGTYGYKLDQKQETDFLMEAVMGGKSTKADALYSQRGFGTGASDIGTTYIEVDMTNQKMYYYKNGQIVVQTDVVTGNTSLSRGTPQRVCYVYFKQRNRVLRGEDYQTPVSYWMAVYGNIGIHDASWRGSFGGTIYKRNGSHGCINTPTKAVSQLYDMVEVGTPVIMFY